jgi:hypothetical protein
MGLIGTVLNLMSLGIFLIKSIYEIIFKKKLCVYIKLHELKIFLNNNTSAKFKKLILFIFKEKFPILLNPAFRL